MRKPQPKIAPLSWHRRILARATPVLCAYFATLLAIPVNAAITLPTDPLTTASRVPPNVLFILDNSGSMASDYMPDSVPRTTTVNVASQAYTRNTLYYNPATTYQPWTKADGTLMTGGTSYGSVYTDNYFVDYSATGPAGSGTISTSSGVTSLYSSVQTFYVPKSTTSNANWGDGTQYWRYQILTDGSIKRSEYGTVATTGAQSVAITGGSSGSLNNNNSLTLTLASVSAGKVLDITINNLTTGSGRRGLNYIVQNPSGGELYNATLAKNSSITLSVNPTVAGQYRVILSRDSSNNTSYSVTATVGGSNACDSTAANGTSGWINCESQLPSSRTAAEELINYATWYSYHRTRYKSAKAGASQAFSELGNDVRVGFRTIWNDTNIPAGSRTGNMPTPSVPIPVNYNDGLFSDTGTTGNTNAYNNRTQWYNRLFTTQGSGSTPLRQSLTDAGTYFGNSSATGPYGPSTGSSQLACRQNFTILTTDGYWNESGYENTTIGNADNVAGETITSPSGASYRYDPADAANAAYPGGLAQNSGNGSANYSTLADVAMYYWKNDLRTDLDNIVPTNSNDNAFWQHMTTFTIGLGLVGTVNQTSVAAVLANRGATYTSGGTTYVGWPTPVNNSITAVDDLLHAAVNGHGTYVAASNPEEFASGLKAALAAVTERTGSFSSVAANSTSLDAGTRVFQATYVSGVWTGDVVAYAATTDGVSATASWRASQNIPATRKLFTSDGTTGLAFPGSATTTQLASLERLGTSNYPVSGANNAAYLAGTRTLEIQNSGTLRNRNHVLGDIVGSSPAYASDTDTLYVGANDGMLHAFDASSGAELFGYIPNGINWSSLGTLSRPDYEHRYFVDGPVVVSTRTQTPNKNILVGALGKGGKGLFALDVTSPSTFAVGNFKWEVGGSDADMGLVQAKPIIAKLNNNVTALIVSNGLNSTNGHAVLFVYNLETGSLIRKIDTGVGSNVTDSADSNGLSGPVGWDADGNGTVDYVYAGDMLGKVWKFNLSATTPATWGVANSGNPIFSATYTKSDGTVVRQPITGGLTIALHPTTYKTWLFFGTGRLMTTGDMTDLSVQSMYGFIDDGTVLARTGTSANLTRRSAVVTGSINGNPVRAFEANSALPASSKGWYLDLVTPPNSLAEGERIVSDAQMLGDVLVTSSVIPTADACRADGRGYLNALDAFTGTSTGPSLFDLDGDGSFNDETLTSGSQTLPVGSVDLNVGMPTLANLMRGLAVVGGSSGSTGSVAIRETRNVGRVSWREVKRGD